MGRIESNFSSSLVKKPTQTTSTPLVIQTSLKKIEETENGLSLTLNTLNGDKSFDIVSADSYHSLYEKLEQLTDDIQILKNNLNVLRLENKKLEETLDTTSRKLIEQIQ